MASLEIRILPTTDLVPYTLNARAHSQQQIDKLAESIKQFGYIVPALVDKNGVLISGHGRVLAAKQVGLQTIPTICIEHLTEAEIRVFRIADNRIAELATWNEEVLAIEFQGLMEICPELDLTVTGYDPPKIDLIIQSSSSDDDRADDVPEIDDTKPTVTDIGDLWILGNHIILCGDARDHGAYLQLLGEDIAPMAITDPPFNVPINGHAGGRGSIKHPEFSMASGEMTPDEFREFLHAFLVPLIQFTTNGSLHYLFMDWRHLRDLLDVCDGLYGELKNICVWDKGQGGMGSFYRSQHELIAVFKNGTGKHVNNIELGRHGRNRTNVWSYPGVTSIQGGRREDLKLHPTVKPVALIADAILDGPHRGDLVLDPFAGSGTIILAAENTGRRARAIEIEPRYVDVTIRRWQDQTGQDAIHAATGMTFAKTEAQRTDDDAVMGVPHG